MMKISSKTLNESDLKIVMIVDDNHTYKPMAILLVKSDISEYRIYSELNNAKHKLVYWEFHELLEELTFSFEELPFDTIVMN